jgi:hypothetical protein
MVAVRGHFDGRVIVPDEPVTLPKNQPLELRIRVVKNGKRTRKRSALDRIVAEAVSEDQMPSDLGYQHDHYLYGTPKKPEPRP